MNIKLYRFLEQFEGKKLNESAFYKLLERLHNKGFIIQDEHFKVFIIDNKNNTVNRISVLRSNNTYTIYQ